MKKSAMLLFTAILISGPAFAQDSSKEGVTTRSETTTTIETPAAGVNANTNAGANVPTQTTVVVPAARDAITGDVVTTTTVKPNDDVSLRDRVRSKMEHK